MTESRRPISPRSAPLLALLGAFALAAPAAAQPPIAPADAKTPADELKSFRLPPGFAAQLVAAEPDIGKPIQIAFDAKGRLWATTSRLYPFPAPKGEKPTDKLYVLSDIGPDGKAGKVTVFADDLNIPIGILPLPDCKSCLVSECGQVVKLTDTDGDGKADRREPILTGFGFEDTHGMTNSFVLLPDGWVYATHGFKNKSAVTAKDGSTVTMQSGNTYRFRPDGSRVEPWTTGQVNPFGLSVDPWLNLYTADCHSKPITQLIRGAVYQSFGKPHDGLGFAPHVTQHDHGSTALCGLAWYEADHFPKEWSGCMFLGNVVTNRINADRIEWKGSTPEAKELPDFLVSGDPWFRPTDLKLGPDGALYVADFYNKVIGHYEVDLKHPARDKDRGRIWRIVWQGLDGKAKPPAMPDMATSTGKELIDRLAEPNLTTRWMATQELIHRGVEAFKRDRKVPDALLDREGSSRITAHLTWVARAFDRAPDEKLEPAISGTSTLPALLGDRWDSYARPHLIRAAGANPGWSGDLHKSIINALAGPPVVARAAAEALIAHPHPDNVAPLVKLIRECPAEDTHLRHAARIALRNAVAEPKGFDLVNNLPDKDPAAADVIADVALGVPRADAADFLARWLTLRLTKASPAQLMAAAEHVGRYGSDVTRARVTVVLRPSVGFAFPLPSGVALFRGYIRGSQAGGKKLTADELAEAAAMATAAGRRADDAILKMAGTSLASDIVAAARAAKLPLPATATEFAVFLQAIVEDPKAAVKDRGDACETIAAIDPAAAVRTLLRVAKDDTAPIALREKAASLLVPGTRPDPIADGLKDLVKAAPYRVNVALATALAGSEPGAESLLAAVKAGDAPARLLQERAVLERLRAAKPKDVDARVKALTSGLPPAEKRLDDLIRQRAGAFAYAKTDPAAGKEVFARNCAACHQIGGVGAKVGPQLDGVGARGADRLCEDVLDPNRNVDAAFRTTVANLADGRTVSGLSLRVEGQVWVLADATGKEVRVPLADVEMRTLSPLSPMPANFDTAVPEAEFYNLLAYLLEQRVKDAGGPRGP